MQIQARHPEYLPCPGRRSPPPFPPSHNHAEVTHVGGGEGVRLTVRPSRSGVQPNSLFRESHGDACRVGVRTRAEIYAIFRTEVNNDALATAQLMGSATERIQVGTWIANIYLRHCYVCAQGAALVAEATGGRFVLGLGVSHEPVNSALQIDMSNATHDVRRYAAEVRARLRGVGPATHLPQRYWTNFARSSTPNGSGLPEWRPVSDQRIQRLLAPSPNSESNADYAAQHHCAFWA
jgi:alkanesulfonate monooxygenase SsuD/methylene tetrahydromethanopterin reductase-like flavin-dependent oxidoreductase (luciferase family)